MNYPRMRNSNVLVRVDRKRTTPGGIVLPDVDGVGLVHGEVIACGPGQLRDDGSRSSMELTVGDKVLLFAHGAELRWQDETLMVVGDREILGLLPT